MQVSYCKLKPPGFIDQVRQEITSLHEEAFICDEIFGERQDSLTEHKDDTNCVVCFTEPSNTIVMPCRHLCICKTCSKRI